MKQLDINLATYLKLLSGLVVAVWGNLIPAMQALLILMVLDFATGVLAGYITKKLNSDISFSGLAKKVLILCIIAAAWVLEHKAGFPAPVDEIVTGGYIIHELISITENAGRAKLPVPQFLLDVMAKLQEVKVSLK